MYQKDAMTEYLDEIGLFVDDSSVMATLVTEHEIVDKLLNFLKPGILARKTIQLCMTLAEDLKK
jgi:hypothetical protein